MNHSVTELQKYCRSIATRPFKARGSVVQRCNRCLMAETACFCQWRKPKQCDVEFILIMHRNEILKPTNTGRLIADIFPENTHAFLWDRTKPSKQLLNAVNDTTHEIFLLFPSETAQPLQNFKKTTSQQKNLHKPIRIVLLDGTWKQASKMARLSPWLQHLPHISINTENLPAINYIRSAPHTGQFSTVQAAASVLNELGEQKSAKILQHYFAIFNQHSRATRQSITPEPGESHNFLAQI